MNSQVLKIFFWLSTDFFTRSRQELTRDLVEIFLLLYPLSDRGQPGLVVRRVEGVEVLLQTEPVSPQVVVHEAPAQFGLLAALQAAEHLLGQEVAAHLAGATGSESFLLGLVIDCLLLIVYCLLFIYYLLDSPLHLAGGSFLGTRRLLEVNEANKPSVHI